MEYVIILALVVVVGFVVWQMIGNSAADRNAGAHGVVDGLSTTSHEGDHSGSGGAGTKRSGGTVNGSMGAGSSTSLHDIAPPEEAPPENNLWKWGILAAVVFGGMMYWLAKEKS